MKLIVQILKPEHVDLFSREIPPAKHRPGLLEINTGELTTPAGLPLSICVDVDRSANHGAVVIATGGIELLSAGPLKAGFQAIIALPTDEQMLVSTVA
jgi:hypothetical protein